MLIWRLLSLLLAWKHELLFNSAWILNLTSKVRNWKLDFVSNSNALFLPLLFFPSIESFPSIIQLFDFLSKDLCSISSQIKYKVSKSKLCSVCLRFSESSRRTVKLEFWVFKIRNWRTTCRGLKWFYNFCIKIFYVYYKQEF